LSYNWCFSRYSMPIHWLVHGHMTSNNETVCCRQIPWVGNIAKTMTSNRKQFTVTCKMLTAFTHDQSVQLMVAWCCCWAFFKICFCFVLLYNKSLNDWILFASNFNVSRDEVTGNIEIETLKLRFKGYKIHCSPQDQSLSVKYYHSTMCSCIMAVECCSHTRDAPSCENHWSGRYQFLNRLVEKFLQETNLMLICYAVSLYLI